MNPSFVHLHVHSNYSLLTGASAVEDLLQTAEQRQMPVLALTDINGLYGAVPFYKRAKEMGIKPILGAEIQRDGGSAVCLARDRRGYSSLCRIVTDRQLRQDFSLAASLAKHQEGLYILSSDPRLLESLARRIERGRLFADLHDGPSVRCAELAAHAERLRLPMAATNDVHFAAPDRHATHRVLTAVRKNVLVDDLRECDLASTEAYMKSPAQMAARFRDFPAAVANTTRIAEDCNLDLDLGTPHFPHYDLPKGETPFSFLWKLAFDGARKRYRPLRPDVIERLRYELEVINKLGFAEYFVIVWDIVSFAHREGIPIVGRGSAANSIVAYCLGITSVDPLKFDLYFERFLNLSRTDCPDIDLDMCWRRRDEVLKYVYERYGIDRVAMIANHNTYQARSAFRDVARVFGLPIPEINLLSSMLPYYGVHSIRDAIEVFPESRDFPIDREPYKSIIETAEHIDGFIRHLSIHVGGIVIADRPLTDYVPLERATKGLIITQYNMGPVEEMGLVKIDLLGQRSLSIVRDTVEAVKQNYNVEIDLRRLPDRDPKTVRFLRTGRTIGCFQIESPGMRNLLQMLRASCILDVIMGLSLIRPGPSGSGMKERFIRRRLGREPVTYPAPQLREVLASTYGVMLYQEDILKVAEAVAGFTLAEGDELRKAISKKRSPHRIAKLHDQFIEGAVGKGLEKQTAEEIWQLIANFASYSYCKSHATTYGHIAYQATYLKAHYPAEFLAAVMSNQAGFYETREYLEEARRLGAKILLPDVNRSGFFFRAKDRAIRIGLMQVRGLSRTSVKSILRARQGGAFASLADFCRRVRITSPEIRNLIQCGAMDGWGRTRPELLWELQWLLKTRRGRRPIDPKQRELFLPEATAPRGDTPSPAPQLPRIADYSQEKKLELEQHLLQLAVSAHPLTPYEKQIRGLRVVSTSRLRGHVGRQVTIVGWLVTMRRAVTKNHEYMKFMTLEDRHGIVEIVLFPKTYQRFGHLLYSFGPYVVRGRVEAQHGAVTLTAQWVGLLSRQ